MWDVFKTLKIYCHRIKRLDISVLLPLWQLFVFVSCFSKPILKGQVSEGLVWKSALMSTPSNTFGINEDTDCEPLVWLNEEVLCKKNTLKVKLLHLK